MTETMIVMSFLLLMIFGFVHFAMLTATKSVVNLAAFSAARAAMVNGFNGNSPVSPSYLAAAAVLDNLRWWSNPLLNLPQLPLSRATLHNRDSVFITYQVPFGMPIFSAGEVSEGLFIFGIAPIVIQPDIGEEGDNAE